MATIEISGPTPRKKILVHASAFGIFFNLGEGREGTSGFQILDWEWVEYSSGMEYFVKKLGKKNLCHRDFKDGARVVFLKEFLSKTLTATYTFSFIFSWLSLIYF